MKAIRMTVTGIERVTLDRFVTYINCDDDIAATLVSKDTAFIVTADEFRLSEVIFIADNKFKDFEIENIK